MWNFEKRMRDAVQVVTGKMKRDANFAPAFAVSEIGFRAANPAGNVTTNVFYEHGLNSGASFNAAVLYLFRAAAQKMGRPVEVKIIRRGKKPKIKPVEDPKAFWKGLPPYGVTQVVLSVPQRDGRSPHVRGQSKPSR
ncbi:MAG: hypothetical protein WBK91_09880 [Alphaproteobacteria bacterium]